MRRRLAACCRQVEQTQQRERATLAAVQTFGAACRESPAAVLSAVGDAIRAADPAADAVVFFRLDVSDLYAVATCGQRARHYDAVRLRRDSETPAARAARSRARASAQSVHERLIPTDADALAVPLRNGDDVCAVAYVSSSRAPLRAGVIAQLVEQSAAPFVLALEREDDRSRATFDSLTGLYTPRALRDLLRADAAAARTSENASFALWFIDTDRFKAVNDAFGHAAGDEVLQTMAALLRAHTTAALDTPARNGGDEFCAIVRDVHKVAAIERAKAFCEAVRAHDFGRYGSLTASVGVACFPYDAREAGALLELADAAMYNSKREGRDCVSFCRAGGFAVHR